VVVGGIDPGAGAGALRDLLTATALGARAHVVGTAFTLQDSGFSVEPRAAEQVALGLTTALAHAGGPSSVKIGMVANAGIARAVASALAASHPGPVVYDPVLRASSGGSLYDGDRASVLALARQATLLTPNLDEAGWLLDRPVRTRADARAAARALLDEGVAAVLLKGGHLEGEATDVLLSPAGETLLSCPRSAGPSPRGTGCALATAIAVELALGTALDEAVASAKAWLAQRIAGATTVGAERHLW
jgi:hydroxymethylpyrimidine kinase/phosphomethylpyrimidine kinase